VVKLSCGYAALGFLCILRLVLLHPRELEMPIREYMAADPEKSCKICRDGFEQMEPVGGPSLSVCPECGNKVERQLSAPSVGASDSGLHDRAKSAGFTTYRKTGKGEYEKKY
jgi:putative FmdB family regulatory protein